MLNKKLTTEKEITIFYMVILTRVVGALAKEAEKKKFVLKRIFFILLRIFFKKFYHIYTREILVSIFLFYK